MKRYIYLLLGALLFAACDSTYVGLEYHTITFSKTTFVVDYDSATITIEKPTYNSHKGAITDFDFGIEYRVLGDDSAAWHRITEPTDVDGMTYTYVINDLDAETGYELRTWATDLDGKTWYGSTMSFTTKKPEPEPEPVVSITCNVEIETKGIMATVALKDVAYLVDDEAQAIESVTLEYARKRSDVEWITVDMTDRESVTLPDEANSYLDEKSRYIYRVTITPEDKSLEPKTTEEQEFETKYAEVTAEISKPDVAIVGDNVEVEVESVEVWFDGVERPDYYNLEYYVYYREPGGEKYYWPNKVEVELTNDGISLSLALASFKSGTEYEFAGAVVAGAEKKVKLSEIASITIPKEETPTPPTPPTPPISGDADTSALAGTWHLTQWRGTEPSFDVYISITDDGIVTLWQRLESREWELYYSTVGYDNNTISGQYSDGTAWSAAYSVAIDGDTMTWTDTTDASDVSVYSRCELPEGITTTEQAATRSASTERFL